MVRTSFSFNNDKELVQLARAYEDTGMRISWPDVAHRMRHTGHTAAALRQRLRSLQRTHDIRVAGFPANFFTPIQRPRGRPPAVTRQLRALAATPRLPRPASRSASNPRRPPQPRQQPALAAPRADPSRTVEAPSSTETTQTSPTTEAPSSTETPQSTEAPSTAETTSTTEDPPRSATPPSAETPTSTEIPSITEAPSTTETLSNSRPRQAVRLCQAPRPRQPNPSNTEAPPNTDGPTSFVTSPGADAPEVLSGSESQQRVEPQTPPLTPSRAEALVTSIFAEVPRAVVQKYDGKSIHKNVGEILAAGVTMVLRELGDIDDRDLFLGIGSGIGNVMAQVVLATEVRLVIGVEFREELQCAGIEAIKRSGYNFAFRDRARFVSKDIMDIRLATVTPFSELTVVFWNNLLFGPHVAEHVKDMLCDMAFVRFVVSSQNFCQ